MESDASVWVPRRRLLNVGVAVVAALFVLLPAIAAVAVAHDTALSGLRTEVDSYAQQQLALSDALSDQEYAAFRQLRTSGDRYGACSTQNLALMRRLDLDDQYLQAVGHVVGDSLTCTSQGLNLAQTPLGPPEVVGKYGAETRLHVRFTFAPGSTFVVTELYGYAAVVNEALSVIRPPSAAAVGLYSTVTHALFTGTGPRDSSLLQTTLSPGEERTFTSHGQVVTITRSRTWLSGSIVALPLSSVSHRTRNAALLLVPIAILGGSLLALTITLLARRRLSSVGLLRSALRRREFYVEYQPVVTLSTGQWIGAEALVRWRRNGKSIPPNQFIPTLEDAGLGPQLTRQVIELVTPDATTLFGLDPAFHLHINLTSADLHDLDTVRVLADFGVATGARPGNVIAEATERGLLDPDGARPVVVALREHGIDVVIDDFGTGYSSLGYLGSFAFTGLKIDKSFVDTIGIDAATSQVVFHIIRIANELGYRITAEGVEQQSQADVLLANGVQYAQGWLYAKAMPIDALIEGLHAHARDASQP